MGRAWFFIYRSLKTNAPILEKRMSKNKDSVRGNLKKDTHTYCAYMNAFGTTFWNQQPCCQRVKAEIWLLLTLSHKETTGHVPHPPSSLMQKTFSLKWKHLTVCVRNPLPQFRVQSSGKEPCHFQSGSSQ